MKSSVKRENRERKKQVKKDFKLKCKEARIMSDCTLNKLVLTSQTVICISFSNEDV